MTSLAERSVGAASMESNEPHVNLLALHSQSSEDEAAVLVDPSHGDTYTLQVQQPDILAEEFKVERACRICGCDNVPWLEQQLCLTCNTFFHVPCYNHVLERRELSARRVLPYTS